MKKEFFNISYEFDRERIYSAIRERVALPGGDYICVADGVIMNTVNRKPEYSEAVNGGMFSICDSSYVPLYIKWIYGEHYQQHSGSKIFEDIVRTGEYHMMFLGGNAHILEGLKNTIMQWNPAVENMAFRELPYLEADEFDYEGIAGEVNDENPDIIWVSLGAPKQEFFMSRLKPHLKRGVMIAVGAAFKFYSGVDVKRAPAWMVRHHMEFVYRLMKEPRKQAGRCYHIVRTLPGLLYREWRKKKS